MKWNSSVPSALFALAFVATASAFAFAEESVVSDPVDVSSSALGEKQTFESCTVKSTNVLPSSYVYDPLEEAKTGLDTKAAPAN